MAASLLQVKAYLVHCFPSLGLNVLREICLYIGQRLLLPCIHSSSLSRSFDKSWTYCLLSECRLLGVLSQQAIELNIDSCEIKEVGEVNISRKWPGLIRVGHFAYAFGGNRDPALKSYEKYHLKYKIWQVIGNMLGEKSSFTPCQVGKEVYLCTINQESHSWEAFNPTSETFRDLPILFRHIRSGSVSFVHSNTLHFVSLTGFLLKWQLNKTSLEPVLRVDVQGTNNSSASSNITPMVLGEKVYWVNLRLWLPGYV